MQSSLHDVSRLCARVPPQKLTCAPPDELDDAAWDYGAPLADSRARRARKEGYDGGGGAASTKSHSSRGNHVDGFGTLNITTFTRRVRAWTLPRGSEEPGFRGDQYAEVGNKLMLALGYEEYVVQGGDWGSFIASKLAAAYGHKSVKAWHTNFRGTSPSSSAQPSVAHQIPATLATARAHVLYGEGPRGARPHGVVHDQGPRLLPRAGDAAADARVFPCGLARGPTCMGVRELVSWSDDYPWTTTSVDVDIVVLVLEAGTRRVREDILRSDERERVHERAVELDPVRAVVLRERAQRAAEDVGADAGERCDRVGARCGRAFRCAREPEDLAADVRAMFGKGGPAFGVVPGRIGYD
ncbi:uncharacterized protein B0H18DRAFT_1200218 [Fomitopsis serialis]|uniref:uncharacterized protein n=1 Tax=Fomitopsis serialis TaxID=139415 RepID=UPI00200805AA|nr:uncharacterized protein B0H18DRAFT_1200218 [Neoantrodia serialis]KAH9917976.1 hypothetical protein B0H18DRAFT_1200218 [Neoantrodia serialis]